MNKKGKGGFRASTQKKNSPPTLTEERTVIVLKVYTNASASKCKYRYNYILRSANIYFLCTCTHKKPHLPHGECSRPMARHIDLARVAHLHAVACAFKCRHKLHKQLQTRVQVQCYAIEHHQRECHNWPPQRSDMFSAHVKAHKRRHVTSNSTTACSAMSHRRVKGAAGTSGHMRNVIRVTGHACPVSFLADKA